MDWLHMDDHAKRIPIRWPKKLCWVPPLHNDTKTMFQNQGMSMSFVSLCSVIARTSARVQDKKKGYTQFRRRRRIYRAGEGECGG